MTDDARDSRAPGAAGDDRDEAPPRARRKWYSPRRLATSANDGFLTIARSAGVAARFVESKTVGGFSAMIGGKSPTKVYAKRSAELGIGRADTPGAPTPSPGLAPARRAPGAPVVPALVFRHPVPVRPEVARPAAPPAAEVPPPAPAPEVRPPAVQSAPPPEARAVAPPETPPAPEPEPEVVATPPAAEPELAALPPEDLDVLVARQDGFDRLQKVQIRIAIEDVLHGSPNVSSGAIDSLVEMGMASEPFLVACLRDAATPAVAQLALEGIVQIGSPQLLACVARLLDAADENIRLVALRIAQRLDDEAARPLLARGLHDRSSAVKRVTLTYLCWRDAIWALPEIRFLCDDPDTTVRWAAVEALATVKPAEARGRLAAMRSGPAKRRAFAVLRPAPTEAVKPAAAAAAEPAEAAAEEPAEAKPKTDEKPKKRVTKSRRAGAKSPRKKTTRKTEE